MVVKVSVSLAVVGLMTGCDSSLSSCVCGGVQMIWKTCCIDEHWGPMAMNQDNNIEVFSLLFIDMLLHPS